MAPSPQKRPLKRALFQTDIVLRIVNRSDEEIAEMDKAIAGFIDPVSNSIKQALERMEHIAQGEGGKTAPLDLCTYTNPKQYALKIDSAQLGRVVTFIEQMDRITILVNTLFVHGMLDAEQNKNFPQEWQKKLNSLCSTLIRIENKAREKAYDEGKGEEVEAAAGKSANPSMGEGVDGAGDDELANLPLGRKGKVEEEKATPSKSPAKKAPAKKTPVKKTAEATS